MREALRLEPLLPRAYVIFAIAEQDPKRQARIVMLASRISKRDLPLRALVLENRAKAKDVAGAIEALDQILRAHPEQQAVFFPELAKALRSEIAPTAFSEIFATPVQWRDAFLDFAVRDERALENLAAIRQRVKIQNIQFDAKLIFELAEKENIEEAERIYRFVNRERFGGVEQQSNTWRGGYPPFDWSLTDRSGVRVRVGDRDNVLEIDIQSGDGGVLASKIIPVSKASVAFRYFSNLDTSSQVNFIRFSASCLGQTEPFYERPITAGLNAFKIPAVPSCKYANISIEGRAWTGSPPIRGTLQSMSRNDPS